MEKFKEMIHYIIYNCESQQILETVLYKLLYFSDFNFHEIYEKPISNETYIRKENGPVPADFKTAKEQLINENKINEEKEIAINYPKYKYNSNKQPELKLLNQEETAVIDDVLDKLSSFNAIKISDYSHGDMPWRVAKDGEIMDYEYVFYRDDEYSVRNYDEEIV